MNFIFFLLLISLGQLIGISRSEATDLLCSGKNLDLSTVGGIHPRSILSKTSDSQIYRDGCGQNIAIMHSQLSIEQISKNSLAASYGISTDTVKSGALLNLHSNPSASRKLFLDFDGYTFPTSSSDSYWLSNGVFNGLVGPSVYLEGINLDGDQSSFSTLEVAYITETWQSISEAFSILNIDVTTEDPGVSGLTRSSISDQSFGMRIVVSSNANWSAKCNCGGVAYQPAINQVNANIGGLNPLSPAFAFNKFDINNPTSYVSAKDLGGVIAHELGHTLGLTHDGTTALEYYPGHANKVWAPIMGSSWNNAIRQWSKNEYSGGIARSPGNGCGEPTGGWWPQPGNKDDFAIFVCNDIPLQTDDFANDFNSAYTITSSNLATTGLIGPNNDIDFFKFTLVSKQQVIITVNSPNPKSATLDVLLKLYDSSGSLIVAVDPPIVIDQNSFAVGMNAVISDRELNPGTYYISIQGAGWNLPSSTGYSNYASVGRYELVYQIKLQNQSQLIISNSNRTNEVGTIVTLTTTGGSGTGAVSYQVTGNSCSITDNKLSATSATTCSVIATKAADSSYNSVNSNTETFKFLVSQSPLMITNNTNVTVGKSVQLTTSGGSGTGEVLFQLSSANSLCRIRGASLTASSATECIIVATKAAQGIYLEKISPEVVFSFRSNQSNLRISNRNTSNRVGTIVTLTTTGGSGTGAVSYQVTGNSCSITDNKLSATSATTCSVIATKEADRVYNSISSSRLRFIFR